MTENNGKHISNIIERTSCKRHGAEEGDACWHILSDNGIFRAVCNRRSRSMFTHEMGKPINKINHGFRGSKKRK